MLELFKWGTGRHPTGYEAFTLIYSKLLKLDCYLIKYGEGSSIPPHVDKVDGKMYRFNVEVWKADAGGIFKCKTLWSLFNRIHLFRPDIEEHSVTPITKGVRYVFSIGKVL
jgi:hypothetical protein